MGRHACTINRHRCVCTARIELNKLAEIDGVRDRRSLIRVADKLYSIDGIGKTINSRFIRIELDIREKIIDNLDNTNI